MAVIADITNGEAGSSVRSKLNSVIGRQNLGVVPVETIIAGTTHTLVPANAGAVLIFTSGSAVTLTIEDNATQAVLAKSVTTIIQAGAGVVTVTAGSGVTLNGDPKTGGQHKAVSIYQRAAVDTWQILGGVA